MTEPRCWKRLLLGMLPWIFIFSVASAGKARGQLGYGVELEVGETYDDNITLLAAAPLADYLTVIRPGVQLLWKSPRLSVSLDYRPFLTLYARHSDQANLRKLSHDAAFNTSYQISPRITLELKDTYSLIPANEGIPDFSRIDVYQTNLLTLSPYYKYEFDERTRLQTTLRGERRDIWKVAGDYFSYGAEIKAEHDLDSFFHLIFSNDLERRQYDDLNSDYLLYTAYLGLGIDLSHRLEANIPLGYQLLKSDHQEMHHNYSYQINVKYFATSRLQLGLDFSQRYLSDLSGQSYDSRHLGGEIKFDLSPRLSLSVGTMLRDFNYFTAQQQPVGDRLWLVHGNISYAISDQLALLVQYDRSQSSGKDTTNDVTVNRYALQLQFKYEKPPEG